MPVTSEAPSDQHRLVRMLRCVRGSIEFDIEIAPRFDYGRQTHQVTIGEDAAACTAGDTDSDVPPHPRPRTTERLGQAELTDGGDLRFTLGLTEGQMRGVVLETGSAARQAPSRSPRSSGCSMRPPGSGGTGSISPRTPAAGARWWSAPRSPSSC